MTTDEARAILGDRANWELRAMRRALETMPLLNTQEENRRLQAARVLLRKPITENRSR